MDHYIAQADNWMPMIWGAVPEIRDIDRVWETTRDTPFYVPREAFRIAARETRDHVYAMELVNRLPENDLIPRSWFKTGYQRMRSDYMYVISWKGTHLETGDPFEASTVVWSNESLTIDEIYQDAGEQAATGTPPLELFDLEVTISTAYHKARAPW